MMEKIKKFLKCFWFPYALMLGSIGFTTYVACKEIKFNSLIEKEALKGNSSAIQFLSKHGKPWKNKTIVRAAVTGNKYALKILKIDENDMGSVK